MTSWLVATIALLGVILAVGLSAKYHNEHPPKTKPTPATICEHDGHRQLCRDTFHQQDT